MFKRLAQLLRQDDIESQVAGKDESFAVPVPRVWGVYWESSQIWGLKMGNTHGKHRDDSLIHQHFLGTSRHVQTHAYIYIYDFIVSDCRDPRWVKWPFVSRCLGVFEGKHSNQVDFSRQIWPEEPIRKIYFWTINNSYWKCSNIVLLIIIYNI